MSIFEPIPREPDVDGTRELDAAAWDDDSAPVGGSFDPRSIWIAGIVVVGIVIAGLVASNTAEPESRVRPAVASRVDPGAAAVEQTEVKQNVPTVGSSASPAAEPVDETSDTDTDDASTWQAPEGSGDDSWSGDSKWDGKPDKPGKGNGRGRD